MEIVQNTHEKYTNIKGLILYCLFHLTWFGAQLSGEFWLHWNYYNKCTGSSLGWGVWIISQAMSVLGNLGVPARIWSYLQYSMVLSHWISKVLKLITMYMYPHAGHNVLPRTVHDKCMKWASHCCSSWQGRYMHCCWTYPFFCGRMGSSNPNYLKTNHYFGNSLHGNLCLSPTISIKCRNSLTLSSIALGAWGGPQLLPMHIVPDHADSVNCITNTIVLHL